MRAGNDFQKNGSSRYAKLGTKWLRIASCSVREDGARARNRGIREFDGTAMMMRRVRWVGRDDRIETQGSNEQEKARGDSRRIDAV